MKVKPIGNRISIKIDEPTAGALNLESKPTAMEYAEILALGPDVKLPLKKGDKIFVKAWAIDFIGHQGEKFYFIAEDTNGICAVVTK